jgi:hypothetical protein
MAFNKNISVQQGNVVVLSGSQISVTGSLFAQQISGSTALFTTITGSNVSGSTARFTTISGSTVTGSTALLTTITASTGTFTGNVLIYGSASLNANPTAAYIVYNPTVDRLIAFPGLNVSGTLSGSTVSFTTITGSIMTGSTALFTTITSSNISGSTALFATITASNITAGRIGINTNQAQSQFGIFTARPATNQIVGIYSGGPSNLTASITAWNDSGTSQPLRMAASRLIFTGSGSLGTGSMFIDDVNIVSAGKHSIVSPSYGKIYTTYRISDTALSVNIGSVGTVTGSASSYSTGFRAVNYASSGTIGAQGGYSDSAATCQSGHDPTFTVVFSISSADANTKFFAGLGDTIMGTYGASDQKAFIRYDPPSGDGSFRVLVNRSAGTYAAIENQTIVPVADTVYRFMMKFFSGGTRVQVWLSIAGAPAFLYADSTSAQLPTTTTNMYPQCYVQAVAASARSVRIQSMSLLHD